MFQAVTKVIANEVGSLVCPRQLLLHRRSLATVENKRLRFDGQTAIITGAGRGLGREYALLLAERGANVVVNDFGGARTGELGTTDAKTVADQVVGEIKAKGGSAIANHDSVGCDDGVERLVKTTIEKFGRIDILINNAGILRDKSFAKLTVDDWDSVIRIHLRGSFMLSKACWLQFKTQKYGRIIMTSSTSGLYGNFGQANYAAAKMGLIGLSNTLAIEGRKDGINSNVVVPMAASRLTEDILPPDLGEKLLPRYVAPLVGWLSHKDCSETGSVFEAAGQWYGRHKLIRSEGKYLPRICDGNDSLEIIADNWDIISSTEKNSKELNSFPEYLNQLLRSIVPDK